ncbi:hypothetical protein D3C71_1098370 [compost metagenome]
MRQGRTAAGMVVGGQRQHAAVHRGAGRVGMLEHVAAAVHAGPLAVPHAIHALDLGAREQVGLLGTPDHGRAEVFVEAGGELDPRRLQVLPGPPQLQVETAQRAAAVAADEAGRVQPGRFVAQALHQRQPYQGLHPAQVDAAIGTGVLVVQRIAGVQATGVGLVGGGGRGEFGGTGHGWPGKSAGTAATNTAGKARIVTVAPKWPRALAPGRVLGLGSGPGGCCDNPGEFAWQWQDTGWPAWCWRLD